MDWKFCFATFVTIFVAELGDKTQVATLAAASQARNLAEVLLAVVLALALAGTLGVVAGRALAAFLDPKLLKVASGILFLAFGIWVLLRPAGPA